jgi:hypothetical protein
MISKTIAYFEELIKPELKDIEELILWFRLIY